MTNDFSLEGATTDGEQEPGIVASATITGSDRARCMMYKGFDPDAVNPCEKVKAFSDGSEDSCAIVDWVVPTCSMHRVLSQYDPNQS